jgi:hypothetical protein
MDDRYVEGWILLSLTKAEPSQLQQSGVPVAHLGVARLNDAKQNANSLREHVGVQSCLGWGG